MKVLMIIPAYNEEKSIVKTVSSLKKAKLKGGTLDYIVINDGSKDNTKEICEKENLNYINLPMRNMKLYQKCAINDTIYFVCKIMHNENIFDSLVIYSFRL